MRITETSVYYGPNCYTLYAAIRHRLDLGPLADYRVKQLGPRFLDQLRQCWPELSDEIECWRQDDDVGMQQVALATTIAALAQAGTAITQSEIRTTDQQAVFDIVYSHEQFEVGLAAGVLALLLLNDLVPQALIEPEARNPAFDFCEARGAFLDLAARLLPSPGIRALVQAARSRGIPVIQLAEPDHIQLGYGCHQHIVKGSCDDIDAIIAQVKPGRFPIAAITGTNGKTTTAGMVSQILQGAGLRVGLATTNGAYADGKLVKKGDMAGARAARKLLQEPGIDAGVFEAARGGLIRFGLGFDRCTVGTVLEINHDHIGNEGVMSLEDMAKVKRIVVAVAEDTAVLNADDRLCLAMAAHTNARQICYVTKRDDHPVVESHIDSGGRAVLLEEGEEGPVIVLYESQRRILDVFAARIPATLAGVARHNVYNAMFAVATAHSMGAAPDNIRRGLYQYENTFEMAAGRMNFFDAHPFKVMLDWAHNRSGLEAMAPVIESIPVDGRRLCTLTAGGNRVDAHYDEMASAAAGLFDHYILFSRDNLRGRGFDEVPRLLRDGLLANGVDGDDITIVPEEERAVDAALRMAAAGDFLALFAYDIERAWNQVRTFSPL